MHAGRFELHAFAVVTIRIVWQAGTRCEFSAFFLQRLLYTWCVALPPTVAVAITTALSVRPAVPYQCVALASVLIAYR